MCVTMKMRMNKKEARIYARKIIKTLSVRNREIRALELIELLKVNNEFLNAKKVALFHPLDHEVNLLKLMELFPEKRYYFPKTKSRYMDFRKVSNLSKLIAGKFGLKEPSESAKVEKEIDVYLVPCLAASGNYRIGHGAGYYDRYFKRLNGYKIGIVFKELKDLNVLIDNHDIPMDLIL